MNPTAGRTDAPADEDPRLIGAAQEYLAALEAGRRPNRAEFVARFPGLAEPLTAYLDALDMVHGAGPLLPRPSTRPAADGPPPVEALGDFHIVREIGRGGMGVVYEAVQLSLGRRVALKVLPFAGALDARQLQRFKNEAQAAAQLHHTNIVPVYAVGCERGTHYYAMQLIEGRNLAEVIGQLQSRQPRTKHDTRGPDGALPPTGPELPAPAAASTVLAPAAELPTRPATRTALFYRTAAQLAAQAADALEHAHQFDVIHRDVKPANLIVDERGNLWVTDFGLAQFHTSQGLTRTGDLMGTLRYMSPEQAAGRHALLDARTDVYSLGATLYELLTLRPMFDGADTQQLLRQILHDEPRRPRAVDRSVPPELETIVLKAVGKNPADRYATAREFGDDLRRFLDHRPILARPPSLARRARKWARRNPTLVGAAVVLCLLTTIGSLTAAWMIHREQQNTLREQQNTLQEQQKAVKRAVQAEAALKLARQSADEMIQISEQELAGKPFTEEARKRMLTSALFYYQGLIAQQSDDAGARAELAVTQEHVNQILADLAVLQGVGRVDLLRRDDVKDALALTTDQRTRLDDLRQRLDHQGMEDFEASHNMTVDQRQQRALEEARTKEDVLDALLTPRQRERLNQIALQLRPGLSAFHDPDVVKDLELTAKEKDGLRVIEAESFLPGPDRRHGPEKGPEPGVQSPTEKFLAVLTEEQKGRWEKLTGDLFKEAPRPFCPPPGGPGPRGPEPHGPPPRDRGPEPHGPPPPPGRESLPHMSRSAE